MPYTYCLLAAGTFLWCLPFVLARTRHRDPSQLDRRARWGIALQCISYSLLWQGRFWERHPQGWQFALAIAFFALACGLSWTGSRALGRHLQLDAALDPAHRLVQSGPYRFIRHPIYTSMLCVLMGTGVLIAPLYLLAPAALVFLAGAGIRMRVEDGILAARFGEQFAAYRHQVPRMLPFRGRLKPFTP